MGLASWVGLVVVVTSYQCWVFLLPRFGDLFEDLLPVLPRLSQHSVRGQAYIGQESGGASKGGKGVL